MPFSRRGGISSSSPGREAKQSRRGEGEGPTSEGESSADWWLVGGGRWGEPGLCLSTHPSRPSAGGSLVSGNDAEMSQHSVGRPRWTSSRPRWGVSAGCCERPGLTGRQSDTDRLRRSPLSCGLTVRVQERAEPSGPMTGTSQEMHSERWRGSHPPHIIVKCSRRMQTTA